MLPSFFFTFAMILAVTLNECRVADCAWSSTQELAPANTADAIASAVTRIKEGGAGIQEGFNLLRGLDLKGKCPDPIFALVHTKGFDRDKTIWHLDHLIADFHLTISGERLVAEYEKSSESDLQVRRAICAFSAYQSGRIPKDTTFGGKHPKAKPLDELTLNLLVRALNEKEPAIRFAAANSIRLAGIPDRRFIEPLVRCLKEDDIEVSNGAALAAAELGFREIAPIILNRLETYLSDSESPYDGEGWIRALGIFRHAPALPLLRRISAPFNKVSDLPAKYTAGTTDYGNEVELARAILEIENKPNRADALLILAEDTSLAGNVRGAALQILDVNDDPDREYNLENASAAELDLLKQYYHPEVIQRLVTLIDDKQPILDPHDSDLSRLGRLAIEITAKKLAPDDAYNLTRLRLLGTPLADKPWSRDAPQPAIDPKVVYPEDLRVIRQTFLAKLEILLRGEDGPLALEAIAVTAPEQRTVEQYLDIATDTKQKPELRVVAASQLSWQPFLLEMNINGGVTRFGKYAPADAVVKLVPILEVYDDLDDWRYQCNIERVFSELLAPAESGFPEEQQTARNKVLSLLRAMKTGEHAKAATRVLESLTSDGNCYPN